VGGQQRRQGEGGMGVVYRARDEQLDRDVALKVLPASLLADEAARQRFRKESLALSRLNHPHICTIYDVGEAEGQTYIVMEYIEGRPLRALIAAGALPVEAAARYGVQIADALAHAHATLSTPQLSATNPRMLSRSLRRSRIASSGIRRAGQGRPPGRWDLIRSSDAMPGTTEISAQAGSCSWPTKPSSN